MINPTKVKLRICLSKDSIKKLTTMTTKSSPRNEEYIGNVYNWQGFIQEYVFF